MSKVILKHNLTVILDNNNFHIKLVQIMRLCHLKNYLKNGKLGWDVINKWTRY